VTLADFTDERAVRAEHGAAITAVGAGLLAADKHLGGLVEVVAVERVRRSGGGRYRRRRHGGLQGLFPFRLEVGAHPLAATFAAEAGFLVAAEADGRVEIVGAVDPD